VQFPVSPDLSIFYETRGEGPPLVLLNGMSQTTQNWMSQVRHLSTHFNVLSWDARGQGRSGLGEQELTLDLHAADLLQLLDALGLERVHLCGFSYGARLALAFAARSPDRVERLVLTSLGDGSGALRNVIVRSWQEVLERGGMTAMAWASIPHILGEDFLSRYEGQMEAVIRATVSRNSEAGLKALLAGLSSFPPTSDDAVRCPMPALVISADRDPLVSLESALALKDSFVNAEHRLVEGCGHTIPVELPEIWRRYVLDFLL